jgi:hypothetical protein
MRALIFLSALFAAGPVWALDFNRPDHTYWTRDGRYFVIIQSECHSDDDDDEEDTIENMDPNCVVDYAVHVIDARRGRVVKKFKSPSAKGFKQWSRKHPEASTQRQAKIESVVSMSRDQGGWRGDVWYPSAIVETKLYVVNDDGTRTYSADWTGDCQSLAHAISPDGKRVVWMFTNGGWMRAPTPVYYVFGPAKGPAVQLHAPKVDDALDAFADHIEKNGVTVARVVDGAAKKPGPIEVRAPKAKLELAQQIAAFIGSGATVIADEAALEVADVRVVVGK